MKGQTNNTLVILFIIVSLVIISQYLLPLNSNFLNVEDSKAEFLHRTPLHHNANLEPSTVSMATLPTYHVVFSTSCSEQQHWESFVFFYHAFKVKQPGHVTRIASGCNLNERDELQKFHVRYIQPLSKNFHVHFTPDFSRVRLDKGKHPYKYFNKPFGLKHWMDYGIVYNETTRGDLDADIVILMDPDMILLRPLLHDFSDTDNHIFVEENPATLVVKQGYPIAQQDGYLHNQWMELNVSYITNLTEGRYVPKPPYKDGPLHWNSGPPYLATAQDMYQIVSKWCDYVPRLAESHGFHLFDEMYGLIWAAIQLKLPFTMIKSIVISNTGSSYREGWPLIDALTPDQLCEPNQNQLLPIGLHYCERYNLGEWFFSKYRIKKNIMDCEKALLRMPTLNDLISLDYQISPPRADLKDMETYRKQKPKQIGSRIAKREVFMLCHMIRLVNEALRYLKVDKCGNAANLEETYTVHNDPSNY